jgi:hypothetical protein
MLAAFLSNTKTAGRRMIMIAVDSWMIMIARGFNGISWTGITIAQPPKMKTGYQLLQAAGLMANVSVVSSAVVRYESGRIPAAAGAATRALAGNIHKQN